MDVRKVIAINRFYAPDHSATAQLLTDLCEHLATPGGARVGGAKEKPGVKVTVITSRLAYDDPKATLPARETINGVTVRRVWTTRFGRAGLWGRALDYATFYLSATVALLVEARPGDTILAKTDPPLISVPASLVARLKGARLVNWCQDLFPETAACLGLRWAAGPLGKLLRKLRNRSLRTATTNVVLCNEMRRHLLAESVPAERIRVIHNWSDPAIRPRPRHRQPAEPFTICYSGNLGRAHAVDAVIELIERTRDIPNLRWRFVGGGVGTVKLQSHVREHEIVTVTFEGYAPRSQLSESLARADAHLVALDPACEGLIHPSKIYGILASGRPAIFLGSATGSVARMLAPPGGPIQKAHDCGITLDATRPDTWRPAIEALIPHPGNPGAAARLATMAQNAHAAHQRHYTREHALTAWRDALAPAEATNPAPAEDSVLAEKKRAAA